LAVEVAEPPVTVEPVVVPPQEPAGAQAAPATRKRVRMPPKKYIPAMKGNSFSYAVTQLQNGVLHPDIHMLFMHHMCQEAPDVVAVILTQSSMKAGLREWGGDAEKAVTSEMKQLHLHKTFKAKR
jgi:hypothetical protein